MALTSAENQHVVDLEHLRLLRFGYIVDGAMTVFMALFGLFYVAMGVMMAVSLPNMPQNPNGPPPAFIGWFFAAIGGVLFIVGGTLAALKFLTANAIKKRRSRALCYVTAALTCLGIPYGTALGICTFIVLGRPSVMALFGQGQGPPSPEADSPPLAM